MSLQKIIIKISVILRIFISIEGYDGIDYDGIDYDDDDDAEDTGSNTIVIGAVLPMV